MAHALDPGEQSDDLAGLSRAERIAVLVLVGCALGAGVVTLVVHGVTNVTRSTLELAMTAAFALYVVSPPIALTAGTILTAISIWAGGAGPALIAFGIAAGFVAWVGSGRLFIVYAGLLAIELAIVLSLGGDAHVNAAIVTLLVAAVSGVVGGVLRSGQMQRRRLGQELRAQARIEEDIRASERRAIADELHDIVAHDLTVIVMNAELAELTDGALNPRHQAMRDAARKALVDMRTIVNTSAPRTPAGARIMRVLDEWESCRRELEGAGYAVRDAVSLDMSALPAVVDASLARFLRESVTNVLKHSAPAEVSIRLEEASGRAVLTVRNRRGDMPSNGVDSGGYGSVRMSERARALGGEFRSVPIGDDWEMCAALPLTAGTGSG